MIWGRKKPAKPTYEEQRAYVIETIRDFLDGTGGKWAWDDFISLPTGYPDLEAVQRFCLTVSNEHPPPAGQGGWCNAEGFRELRRKLEELEGNDTRERINPS